MWADLRGLGHRALDGLHIEDVDAVAREMALRARHNVDLLVDRLSRAGFAAHTNDDAHALRALHLPPTAGADALAGWLDETFRPVPRTVLAWMREVGDVWLVGAHPPGPTRTRPTRSSSSSSSPRTASIPARSICRCTRSGSSRPTTRMTWHPSSSTSPPTRCTRRT
ncbi:hypothetical protein NKG05_03675 [Oerskovia sp. M15]